MFVMPQVPALFGCFARFIRSRDSTFERQHVRMDLTVTVAVQATVREGFELASAALFAIDVGGMINVLESRTTEAGQVRLRFDKV